MERNTEKRTERLSADPDGIARAAELLSAGRLVAFPTETVYGLGADAMDGRAAAGVFEAKGRPRFNPLIAHAPDVEAAARLVRLDPRAERLAAAFWPGPLTLVAPRRTEGGLAEIVTAGLETAAVRVPAHPVAQALLRAVGRPIAAPSANPSGAVSPTTAQHVLDGLGGRIDAVLDAGPCAIGLESTILKAEPDGVRLLRAGGAPREAVEEALGARLLEADPGAPVQAPGALARHYAPSVRLRLDAARPEPGEGWLGFGPDPRFETPPAVALNLSPSGDPREAAAALFAGLREIDRAMGGGGSVAVARIPAAGLGEAIRDRLKRAATPEG
ncbi:MAG: L-threonylcarbamoyladenylate synthase [Pseudomonadota bacterium]